MFEPDGIEFAVTFSESPGFDVDMVDEMRVSRSYNDLEDKPRLNGETIVGDMVETDPTVPNWAKAPTKPEYNAEEVGAIPEGAMVQLDAGDFAEMWEATI